MAIPFDVSVDDEIDQVFAGLHEMLQRLYRIVRQQSSGQPPTISRVRGPVGDGSRQLRDESGEELPRLVSDLELLTSSASRHLEPEGTLQPQAMSTLRRHRRRRTTIWESSCCEESKVAAPHFVEEESHRVWTQMGMPLLKVADDFDDGKQSYACKEEKKEEESDSAKSGSCRSQSIFSKLIPDLSSRSIWTAVIWVVGWHLLRAR